MFAPRYWAPRYFAPRYFPSGPDPVVSGPHPALRPTGLTLGSLGSLPLSAISLATWGVLAPITAPGLTGGRIIATTGASRFGVATGASRYGVSTGGSRYTVTTEDG